MMAVPRVVATFVALIEKSLVNLLNSVVFQV